MASASAFATSVSGMKSIESVIYKTKKTTSSCSTSSFSFQCRAFRKPIGKNSKRRIMKRRVSLTPRCEIVSTEDLVRDDQKNISKTSSVSALKASGIDKTENTGEEALQMFLKERQLEGDFVSKLFDILWRRDDLISADSEASMLDENPQLADGVIGDENDGGFLKLTKTQEWVLGDETAPINKKAAVKLKKEMMMLTVGIGIACSGYCLVAFSVQAAISYAVGVLFSCLYLQLLSQYVDNLSREEVPQIFMKKKLNKIGIRSEDLQNLFERTINGSFVALSSPRLVIPVAIYGLWWLSYHFSSDIFGFELVPAMFGLFAYKAAALVQVYRDNEDLKLVFPEN